MDKCWVFFVINLCNVVSFCHGNVLGCGGFIKSHVLIDFSKVEIQLYTKTGILKESATCAPNSGYYFIPVYDLGKYVLKLQPPAGWSFNPTEINLNIDGINDVCSKEEDINFVFEGFGIAGRVESFGGSGQGPAGVTVELTSASEKRLTLTTVGGNFFFTPVYPGNYTVTLRHPTWTLAKNHLSVTVTEGNTELPANSLVVLGYDVTGLVRSDGAPVAGVTVIIYSNEKNKGNQIRDCDKTPLADVPKANDKYPLCHVKTNEQGKFVFASVPLGNYSIQPIYQSQNVHFEPKDVTFTVAHDSVAIANHFNIIGISASGRILYGKNKDGVANVPVFLDDKLVTTTDIDGKYNIENINIGKHKIYTLSKHLEFAQQEVLIQPLTTTLPDIYPIKYEICGKVLSDQPETVLISRSGSTDFFTVTTNSSNNFCQYLSAGKYTVYVRVDKEKTNTVRFFPESYPIEVVDSPVFDIVFSQLKATVFGKVQCIKKDDCDNLKVTLTSLSENPTSPFTTDVTNGAYEFLDIRPGKYQLSLSDNIKCWNANKQTITVSSVREIVPPFKQTGYKVVFVSSHDTQAYYKIIAHNMKELQLNIAEGKHPYCVEQPGKYRFRFQNCHVFQEESVNFDTDSDSNVIHINAIQHRIGLEIRSDSVDADISVTVNIDGRKTQQTAINYSNGTYVVDIYLSPTQSAILVPESEILYFNPPILSINGENDCTNLGVKFIGTKGRVFQGKVTPPLTGVIITVETEKHGDAIMVETDENGFYRFQPLDDSKTYRLSAKKDSYALMGPDENNNFVARKLAEVKVEVSDDKFQPVQGTLLSLSGGHSYRSNLQTDKNGTITFYSLSPGEYFLRPVMKEYILQPSSQVIQVEEGATVVVRLKAKRIAYSIYGTITSLSGETEDHLIIHAIGKRNCSRYSEETNTEGSGLFRIRGLQPYCDYAIRIKGSLDLSNPIERALPDAINITVTNQDVIGLEFTIFRKNLNMDMLVYVYVKNIELYKFLRLKLQRESSPADMILSTKLDLATAKSLRDNNPGVLLQLPSIPWDNKSYSIQLESTSQMHADYKSEIKYFGANSSFKYISLSLSTPHGTGSHFLKQTSIWPLIFIFSCLLALYFIADPILYLNKFIAKLNIGSNINGFKLKSAQSDLIHNNDIDQIVQNINATKKVKSRKT